MAGATWYLSEAGRPHIFCSACGFGTLMSHVLCRCQNIKHNRCANCRTSLLSDEVRGTIELLPDAAREAALKLLLEPEPSEPRRRAG